MGRNGTASKTESRAPIGVAGVGKGDWLVNSRPNPARNVSLTHARNALPETTLAKSTMLALSTRRVPAVWLVPKPTETGSRVVIELTEV